MEKTRLRIILVLAILLVSSLSLFLVLYTEQKKIRQSLEGEKQQDLARMKEIVRAREAYYDAIAKEKEALQKQMAKTKADYENLLQTQESAIAGKTQTVTQTTEQTVPVTVTKPKSASKTKSS